MRFPTTEWTPIEERDFRRLVELYRPVLIEFAMYRGLQRHDADDVVQRVCITFCKEDFLAEVNRQRGRFRSLLCALACHVISDFRKHGTAAIRDRRREISLGDLDISSGPQDNSDFISIWIGRLVQEAIDCFAGESWTMTVRLRSQGKSYGGIAAELGTSESTESSRFHRSKPFMRDKLTELIGKYSLDDDFPEELAAFLGES
jgi:RNA polymerase sigma factor (sigma-70 family)